MFFSHTSRGCKIQDQGSGWFCSQWSLFLAYRGHLDKRISVIWEDNHLKQLWFQDVQEQQNICCSWLQRCWVFSGHAGYSFQAQCQKIAYTAEAVCDANTRDRLALGVHFRAVSAQVLRVESQEKGMIFLVIWGFWLPSWLSRCLSFQGCLLTPERTPLQAPTGLMVTTHCIWRLGTEMKAHRHKCMYTKIYYLSSVPNPPEVVVLWYPGSFRFSLQLSPGDFPPVANKH